VEKLDGLQSTYGDNRAEWRVAMAADEIGSYLFISGTHVYMDTSSVMAQMYNVLMKAHG